MKQSVLQRYENVKLLSATPFYTKSQLDMEYLLSLKVEYLLQNHLHEAGILGEEDTDIPYMWGLWDKTDYHKGWEDPTSQLRGHFLGHWLSAAAYMYKLKEEPRLKGKIEYIIGKLAECQERNGNGWAAGIPEKYLQWVAEGKTVWAPHYNIHKTFMGLIDVARIMDNKQAYEIAANFAEWFYKWSGQFSEEKMQDILECETGGMMEAFADLYSLSKDPKHLELMKRYERSRLFDRMMADEDILTNTHANTTIPEIHGLCRAFEVTGDKRYYDRMEKYWMLAVEKRGVLATGGQTLGEIWMPENMGARYGYKNQEHCTVYNMIRLADYLYRATGDVKYQDYIEVNLYNGTMAQCFYKGYNSDYGHHLSYGAGYKKTVVTYFLPLGPGAKKPWASEKNDFFCCHGSAVQACATFQNYIFYKRDKGIIINQYIDAIWEENEKTVILKRDHLEEEIHRPKF